MSKVKQVAKGERILPKIEKNVPLPDDGRRLGITKLLRAMDVGDSVLLGTTSANTVRSIYRRLRPARFTSRTVPNGLRVWRIE